MTIIVISEYDYNDDDVHDNDDAVLKLMTIPIIRIYFEDEYIIM